MQRRLDRRCHHSSMLFVDVPCAMSFRTLCLPCGVCRPRYALRIFRPTIPSTYASPRAVSLVVFTDMAIVRREISSSISYTASFLGTICLEVPSPIPTVFFLHLTVALQRRTVYDFLISSSGKTRNMAVFSFANFSASILLSKQITCSSAISINVFICANAVDIAEAVA